MPLRIVCPYTYLHPLCEESLAGYEVEYVEMFRLDDYFNLLSRLWAEGQTFLVVEHDIEIHPDVVPQMEKCPAPWCAFPYNGGLGQVWDKALGCTKFHESLLRELPSFLDEVQGHDWRRLDVQIAELLEGRVSRHAHWPIVKHHHMHSEGCDCGEEH